jgi:hypothetical protein
MGPAGDWHTTLAADLLNQLDGTTPAGCPGRWALVTFAPPRDLAI